MRAALVGAGVVLAAATAGCRSFHGRYVSSPMPREDVGGVPVVVETPRYLKVTYTAVDAVLATRQDRETATGGVVRTWAYVPLPTRVDVRTEVVSVGEVYAIDVERPFAGTAKNSVDWFADGSHPRRVASDVRDDTVSDVAGALEKLVPLAREEGAVRGVRVETTDPGLVPITVREVVLKIQYFDVRDPRCLIKEFCPEGCDRPPPVALPPLPALGPPSPPAPPARPEEAAGRGQ